jgi:hypothetical protein
VAVKADLGSNLTKIVVGVVVLITSAIEIVKKLVVFIGYKVSNLEVFRVAITKRVGINVKVIRQQQ